MRMHYYPVITGLILLNLAHRILLLLSMWCTTSSTIVKSRYLWLLMLVTWWFDCSRYMITLLNPLSQHTSTAGFQPFTVLFILLSIEVQISAMNWCTLLWTVQYQFCPIPTGAPWSIVNKERSNGFLHRAIDKLEQGTTLNCRGNHDVLRREVEMAWNFVQHVNNFIPHNHHFGQMPRKPGDNSAVASTQERIAVMELVRTHTE